jgi:uncharacterized membrane protein YgdD (TMEM256/DUF423 family)
MTSTARIRLAALVLFLGIALGAFGAHGLADRLEETGRLDNWETATFYHLLHGLALFVLALLPGRALGYYWFLAGIVIFSGSLYALALTDISRLGAITPIGGVSFLVGWARWIFHRKTTSAGPDL